MKEKRRISSSGIVRPPSLADGMDMRTWLAGCALANGELMQGCDTPEEAAERALEYADRTLACLKAPVSPNPNSLKQRGAPSPARRKMQTSETIPVKAKK